MKTIVLALLFLISACSKETSTLQNPIQGVIPVSCSGNIFDGTLNVDFLNPNVDLTGALSSSAEFVISNNQCVIQACDAGYTVAADKLSCEAGACTPANANIANATSVSGDVISGCIVNSCSTNYQVNPTTNSCDAVLCTPTNSGIANALTVTGDLINGCNLTSCQAGYANVGNTCQAIACTTANANIPFANTVIGTLVSGCSVTSCQTNYSPAADYLSCVANSCDISMVPNSTAVGGDVVSGCFATSCQSNYLVNGTQCSPVACTISNANIPNSTAVSGDLIAGCTVTSCSSNYEVNPTTNSCDAILCTPANSGISNVLSVSGTLVSGCSVTSCQTNYSQNGNICEATMCSPSDIANSLTVSGTLVSGCTVTSCHTNYTQNGNACEATMCTPSNSNISNATAVSGTLVSGCTVTACQNPEYEVNPTTNSCDAVMCTPTNSGIANVLTVSGDLVSGCSVTSCQANYSQNGNLCEATMCLPANIPNSLTVSGDLISGCVVDSCQTNYTPNGTNTACDAVLCTPANANIANATTVTGDLVLGCTVTSCSANYEVNPTTNSCDAVLCTPANSGISNVLSVSGDLITGCSVTSCQTNYTQNGNLCEATMCTPSDIANSLTVSGTLVSGCSVTSCQTNYTQNGNLCEATMCTPSNSNISNATAVSGDLVNGCTVNSCAANYEVNPTTNSCDAISCTPTNSGIANVLTVSGDLVVGCSVTSCQTNYTQNGNLCEATMCTPSDIANSLTVSGTLVSGCSVSSCQNNYIPNGANTACDAIACTPANANISNATAVSGTLVSGCTVNSCESNYEVNTPTNSCDSMLCTVANANIPHATDVTGLLSDPECTLVSCEAGYAKVGNVCQAVSCTPANSGIANVLTVSGFIPTGCNLVECQPLYTPDFTNNLCEQSPCTLANALGHGISDISNVSTVSGTITDNSCLVASCDDFYKIENNACVAKSCADLSSGEASILGFNLTGGSLSGTYPTCSLTCSSSLQELASDGKSCIDKTPSITIDLPEYTNQINNMASITVTNAKTVRYYSDGLCSVLIEELDAPGENGTYDYSFNVGGTVGLKSRSVKVLNGILESSCYSDSIYFDTINPIVNVTSPIAGLDLLANTVEVTGSCSDNESGIDSIIITVGGVLDFPATCNSGSYSQVVNVANLPDGAVGIDVMIRDNAGNEATSSTSINKNTYGSIQGVFIGGGVNTLYRQADGKLLVGGSFVSFTPTGESSSVACWSVARINANGTLDRDFCLNVRVNGPSKNVYGIATDSNNNIIIVGNFSAWGSVQNKTIGIAKLNPDGSLNETFANNLTTLDGSNNIIANQSGFQSSAVLSLNAVVTDSNNNIYVGGNFTSFKGVNFETRAIAKISPLGILDPTFTANLNPASINCQVDPSQCGFNRNRTGAGTISTVNSLLIVGNSLFVGGSLGKYGNDVPFSSSLLAKMSLNGVLDQTFRNNNFNPTQRWKSGLGPTLSETGAGTSANVAVNSMYYDGVSLFVGGSFRHYQGTWHNARGIAKFSLDGVFDTNFSTNIGWGFVNELNSIESYTVRTIQESLDGDLIIGGTFTHFGGNAILSGIVEKKPTPTTESTYHAAGIGFNNFATYTGPTITIPTGTFNSGDTIGNPERAAIFRDNNEIANAGNVLKISKAGIFDIDFSNSLDVVSGVKVHSQYGGTTPNDPSGIIGTVTSLLMDFAGNLYLSSMTPLQYKNHASAQEKNYVLKILPDMTLAD